LWDEALREEGSTAQYQSLLARRAAQLTRARVLAELVVIDQEREVIVVRRNVRLTRKS
jgi:hypothetical protein